MRKFLCSVPVVLSLIFCSVFYAENIYPVYDTYTVPEGGQQNGLLGEFWTGKRPGCGHDENAMLYFDLSMYMGSQVDTAVLHLNRFFGCSSNFTNADFFHASEYWDETYDGPHIAHGDQIWANNLFNADGWWEIDVKDLVQAWLNDDMPNYGLVIECRQGSGTSKFHSKDASNESVRPYLELEVNGEPTPTEEPEATVIPTSTPDVEFTPTPSAVPGDTFAEVYMPSDMFHPGDDCSCSVTVHNNEGRTLDGYPLCVVLEVYGSYYFAPGFDESFDCFDISFPQNETQLEILSTFPWPEGAGSAQNIKWFAALLRPDMTDIFGTMGTFTFGWRDE